MSKAFSFDFDGNDIDNDVTQSMDVNDHVAMEEEQRQGLFEPTLHTLDDVVGSTVLLVSLKRTRHSRFVVISFFLWENLDI